MARKRKSDAKEAALAETRTLNPRPEAVRDEQFASSEFFDARDLVQVKYEMVRRVRVDGAPVTPRGGRVRVLPAVVLRGRRRGGPRRAGWAGAGQARAAAGAQAHRRGHRLRPAAARAGSRRWDRRSWLMRSPSQVRDQGAPAIGGAGPGPR